MAMFFDPQMLGTGPAPGAGVSQSLVKALLAKKGSPSGPPSMAPKPPMPSQMGDLVSPSLSAPDLQSDAPVDIAGTAAPFERPSFDVPNLNNSLGDAHLPEMAKKPGMLDRIGNYLKSPEG